MKIRLLLLINNSERDRIYLRQQSRPHFHYKAKKNRVTIYVHYIFVSNNERQIGLYDAISLTH